MLLVAQDVVDVSKQLKIRVPEILHATFSLMTMPIALAPTILVVAILLLAAIPAIGDHG